MPPRMLSYRWFAKVYGWTPDQVDELPMDAWEWMPRIEAAEARAQELAQAQAKRDAARR